MPAGISVACGGGSGLSADSLGCGGMRPLRPYGSSQTTHPARSMHTRIASSLVFSILLAMQAIANGEAVKPPGQFLGILRLREQYHPQEAWTREASEAVGRHFVRLQEHAKVGKVILAGRTKESNDRTMGLVIFEAENLEAATEFMEADPAVVAGIMSVEVRPYAIAVSRGAGSAGAKASPSAGKEQAP
jgi:uncharacterized protein YciI